MVFREGWLHPYAPVCLDEESIWDVFLVSVVMLTSKQSLVILKDGKSLYFLFPYVKAKFKNKTILNLHLHARIIVKGRQIMG